MKISEMDKAYLWYCPLCHWPNYIDCECVAVGLSMWCEHCDRYTTVEDESEEDKKKKAQQSYMYAR